MKRLKNKNLVPPDGYQFIEKRTGLELQSSMFSKVVIDLIEHRKYRKLEPTDLKTVEEEVEAYNVQRVPNEFLR